MGLSLSRKRKKSCHGQRKIRQLLARRDIHAGSRTRQAARRRLLGDRPLRNSQAGPEADQETIERVYRTLASRFHPDNPNTGDPETFLRITEAYETLSSPVKRAQYNVLRQCLRSGTRFRLRGREFFDGVRGEQNRRLAALCLLYRQRISTYESPGLTLPDIELLTGCTREELGSALWYLCQKQWAKFGEATEYSITADGFDVVESKLEDHLELRPFATLRYYARASHAELEALSQPLL